VGEKLQEGIDVKLKIIQKRQNFLQSHLIITASTTVAAMSRKIFSSLNVEEGKK
jgi:hypothetical protein